MLAARWGDVKAPPPMQHLPSTSTYFTYGRNVKYRNSLYLLSWHYLSIYSPDR